LDSRKPKWSEYINGELEFHGVTKQFAKIPVSLEYSKDKIILSGNFSALASDFDIKIPKFVQSKVTDEVQISFSFELLKK